MKVCKITEGYNDKANSYTGPLDFCWSFYFSVSLLWSAAWGHWWVPTEWRKDAIWRKNWSKHLSSSFLIQQPTAKKAGWEPPRYKWSGSTVISSIIRGKCLGLCTILFASVSEICEILNLFFRFFSSRFRLKQTFSGLQLQSNFYCCSEPNSLSLDLSVKAEALNKSKLIPFVTEYNLAIFKDLSILQHLTAFLVQPKAAKRKSPLVLECSGQSHVRQKPGKFFLNKFWFGKEYNAVKEQGLVLLSLKAATFLPQT